MDETRKVARENLGIPLRNKVILSIDGGGMRGIFTLQILKKLEWLAGSPCYKWCDMVAGTSTGGLISSLILNKKSTIEIEEIYDTLVSKFLLNVHGLRIEVITRLLMIKRTSGN